jgi:hypothetical protein
LKNENRERDFSNAQQRQKKKKKKRKKKRRKEIISNGEVSLDAWMNAGPYPPR